MMGIIKNNNSPDFLIRCTGKLAQEQGVKLEPEDGLNVMSERHWQGNIFTSNRRKCLIFTHALTLYSFFILRVVRKDLDNLSELFQRNLEMTLKSDQLYHPLIIPLEEVPPSICFAKSQNASLLASMTNLVLDARSHLEGYQARKDIDSVELSALINEAPMGMIGYQSPVERMYRFIIEKQKENAS